MEQQITGYKVFNPDWTCREFQYKVGETYTHEGMIVLDNCMGSGTTAKMAHLYKRNWIGSEISSEYVELANKRLDPYLRQTSLF